MKKLLLCLLLWLAHPCLSFGKNIPFAQYLALALKHDPEYQAITAERKKLLYLVDQGLPSRETTLSLRNESGYSSDSDKNTTLLRADLSKKIIASGTELALSHSKTTRPDREENVTQFRFEQSLYKNMFGRDTRLQKESLTEREKLKALEIQESEKNYWAKTLKQYLELSKAFREYKLAQKIYREAVRLKKSVQSKVASKVARRTDLNRSQLLVLLRREEVLEKRNTFRTLKNKIEKTINDTFGTSPAQDSDKLVAQLQTMVKQLAPLEWTATRAYQMSQLSESFHAKESLLQDRADAPDFRLIAGYSKDNSSRFSATVNRNETVIGLRLDIPFGDTKSSANYQLSKVELLKSQIQTERASVEFEKSKEALANGLKQAKERLKIDAEKVRLTGRIIVEEEKRFAIGKIDLETLIQLKSDYGTYRTQRERSRLRYGRILIDWLTLNDALQTKEMSELNLSI